MSEPKNPGGLKPHQPFQVGDYRYSVLRPLVIHPDYDTLLLASRQHAAGEARQAGGPQARRLEHGREASRARLEEVRLARSCATPTSPPCSGTRCRTSWPTSSWTPARPLPPHPHGRRRSWAAACLRPSRPTSPPRWRTRSTTRTGAVDEEGRPLHLVHRAVGPMRIRLGANGRVQLTNFGAAYSELLGRIRTPRTPPGRPGLHRPGNPPGLPPARGGQRDLLTPRNLDGRADIFSLGLVLLEMLLASYPLDPPDSLVA